MKRLGKGLVKTVRLNDWLDWSFLAYMVGAGILFGYVMEVLWREFRP